jgi:hypothetical protein
VVLGSINYSSFLIGVSLQKKIARRKVRQARLGRFTAFDLLMAILKKTRRMLDFVV